MMVLVCGGRNYDDREALFTRLDIIYEDKPIMYLLHGGARGADSLAGEYAKERGIQEVICPANWDWHGRAAGSIRNRKMAGLNPDLVVAFPGGVGTKHMVEFALKREIPVING